MADTVYVLGAGINRGLHNRFGGHPPLATDLFEQVLLHSRFDSPAKSAWYRPLFEYIQRFWKLSADDLATTPFDLEDCYTLLQLQAAEARSHQDMRKLRDITTALDRLTTVLFNYLSEFSGRARTSVSFLTLGRVLYAERPVILTFNYDTLLEDAIASASGVHPGKVDVPLWDNCPGLEDVADDVLPQRHFNWNPLLAYGIEFDEVQLPCAGISPLVCGKRFYNHAENRPCTPTVLKMHGSLSWSRYTGRQLDRRTTARSRRIEAGRTVAFSGMHFIPVLGDQILEPIIVTPVLYKDLNADSIIRQTWQRARRELTGCKRLIVGGYSFPPTDFYARKLFLEAFAERPPDEVVVINPDKRVIEAVDNLTHFKNPIRYDDLDEFVARHGEYRKLVDEWDVKLSRSLNRGT